MKRRPTSNKNFTRTARRVHPKNHSMVGLQMRGGIRL